MIASRKSIYAALFTLASNAGAFVTKSRTVVLWSDCPPANQPALYQAEGKQLGESAPRIGTKWTFHAELIVYAHEANTFNDGDVVDLLNDLVDGLVTALAPSPATGTQTLGGLVHDCRIQGTIETSEGRLGQQAVAVIPVLIIANV